MQNNKIIIAIDGFSSSGKSTMARQLAEKIGYAYIDSGAMYRAVTLYAIKTGIADTKSGKIDTDALINDLPIINISFKVDPTTKTSRTILNGEDVETSIRGMEVSGLVSPVAAIPEVRHHLVAQQQAMGKSKGIVMDGRDIGTTVFPDAEMKIFVNASPEVRAIRRLKELQAKGTDAKYDEVYANICERDHIDRTRKESPLRKADDAILLDNDNLSREEQMQWLVEQYKKITNL